MCKTVIILLYWDCAVFVSLLNFIYAYEHIIHIWYYYLFSTSFISCFKYSLFSPQNLTNFMFPYIELRTWNHFYLTCFVCFTDLEQSWWSHGLLCECLWYSELFSWNFDIVVYYFPFTVNVNFRHIYDFVLIRFMFRVSFFWGGGGPPLSFPLGIAVELLALLLHTQVFKPHPRGQLSWVRVFWFCTLN
jgi:hypothetical protein